MPQFLVTTSRGLKEPLCQELKSFTQRYVRPLGFDACQIDCNWQAAIRIVLNSRVATRVLLPVMEFHAYNLDEVYNNLKKRHDFTKYIRPDQTLRVKSKSRGSHMDNSMELSLKIKDAIVDQFWEKFDRRPNISKDNPDLLVSAKIVGSKVSVSVDLAGFSLSQRGYRQEGAPASLREHVAAGLIGFTDWKPGEVIVDPFCGSGTFLIEAALMALKSAPGAFRPMPSCRNFKQVDSKIFKTEWDSIKSTKENRAISSMQSSATSFENGPLFFGFDQDKAVIDAAKKNIERAGVKGLVHVQHRSLKDYQHPVVGEARATLMTNPPWGERLQPQAGLEKDFGNIVKAHFSGRQAYILSGTKDFGNSFGLKAKQRWPVDVGGVDARWLKYEVF